MKGIWFKEPPAMNSIIFIHGVLSDGETGWTSPGGSYWPKIVSEEEALAKYGIYVFSYETGFFSGNYSLSDTADALREWMITDRVINSNRLIFVCHSMGGIVARRFIVANAIMLKELNVSMELFLLASPSLGSKYADWLAPISEFVGHKQADALRFISNNQWLSDLDKDFLNIKDGKQISIRGKELIEDKFIVFKGLFRDTIVEQISGARYFGQQFKVPNSDHISISKPSDRSAIQHRRLVDFIKSGEVNDEVGGKEEVSATIEWFRPDWRQKRYNFRRAAETHWDDGAYIFGTPNLAKDISDIFRFIDYIGLCITQGALKDEKIPSNFKSSAVRYEDRGRKWLEWLREEKCDQTRYQYFTKITGIWKAKGY